MSAYEKFIGAVGFLAAYIVIVPVAGLLVAWLAGWLKRLNPPVSSDKIPPADR